MKHQRAVKGTAKPDEITNESMQHALQVSSNEANNNTQGTMVRICTTEGKMTLFLS
jgi:hypothetical protein